MRQTIFVISTLLACSMAIQIYPGMPNMPDYSHLKDFGVTGPALAKGNQTFCKKMKGLPTNRTVFSGYMWTGSTLNELDDEKTGMLYYTFYPARNTHNGTVDPKKVPMVLYIGGGRKISTS